MNKRDFNSISIRGRIAYAILCFENYYKAKYPNQDGNPIFETMWRIVGDSGSIDDNAYYYMEIIPEYLFEFASYEESGFEYLTKEKYDEFKMLIDESDKDMNTIMHAVYDIAMEYAYTAIPDYGKKTIEILFEAIDIIKRNNVDLPEFDKVSAASFTQYDGWGEFVNRIQ